MKFGKGVNFLAAASIIIFRNEKMTGYLEEMNALGFNGRERRVFEGKEIIYFYLDKLFFLIFKIFININRTVDFDLKNYLRIVIKL